MTKTKLERVKGIEPSCSAWKADILPLNYTRTKMQSHISLESIARLCAFVKGYFSHSFFLPEMHRLTAPYISVKI